MPRRSRKSRAGSKKKGAGLPVLNPNAAGIDIGAEFHMVAVPEGSDEHPVRRFRSFTTDLHALADWLAACGIETVAMESTGVYWIPLFELLEERAFEVVLVNAHHVKNVPGRKSDVSDCQWIQRLHSFGLLAASFRPADEIVSLRGYLRHRENLVRYAAAHIQHMQKALTQMNVQLHHVISNITGETGMAIMRDIVSGNHDPQALAKHRNFRCRASEETIAAALTGNYRPEHLFALKQALQLYDFYKKQIEECDAEIEGKLAHLTAHSSHDLQGLPPPRKPHPPRDNEPRFDARPLLYQLTGADLTQIDGIGPYTAMRLISEIGTDMSRWSNVKKFTAWTTLAPRNKITGGKVITSKTQSSANRVAYLLRGSVRSLIRTQTALGAHYRRLAARIGRPKAITATARKLAEHIYRALRYGTQYQDPGADYYDIQHRTRVLGNLSRRAKSLGYQLVPLRSSEPAHAAVS
jgi:transposase